MLLIKLVRIGPVTGPRPKAKGQYRSEAEGQGPIQQTEDLQLGQYEITWLMTILLTYGKKLELGLAEFFCIGRVFRYWPSLLAHLTQRLTRWAYSIPMVRRPSIIRRRRPHFQPWISLKPVGQSWSNFMCSITGVGERLHKVLRQIGSKLWFPWQQKAPIDL